MTSVAATAGVPDTFYRVAGYHLCGPRAVRIDMLERLADMIRPLIAWRAKEDSPTTPPKGASGDGGFTILPEMMSILGCNSGELAEVLKALGFRLDRKPAPPKPSTQPVDATSANAESVAAETTAEAPPQDIAPATADAVTPAEAPAIEAPVAEASAEAPAVATESPPAPSETAPAAPAEPQFIDIWRPRRRYDENRRDHQQHRQRRPHHRRPSDTLATDGATATPADATAANPGEEAKPAEGRHDRRQHHGKRRHGRRNDGPRRDAPQGDLPPQAAAQQSRSERNERPPRRSDRPREEKRAVFDPNSPFAALSALKEKLEAESRKPGSSS